MVRIEKPESNTVQTEKSINLFKEAKMPNISSKRISYVSAFFLSLATLCQLSQAITLTYTQIANRLLDLQYLATLPEVGVTTQEFTSYDRGSTYNAGTDTYVNWFANNDCCGSINGTLLDTTSRPGVIWVSWSATPGAGTLPVYFNGSTTPAINIAFVHWFDRTVAPFNYTKLIMYTREKGSR